LKSVRRRIAALYGARGHVDVGADPGGFAVTIALPLTPPDDLDTAA
jgi:hypothetical protein